MDSVTSRAVIYAESTRPIDDAAVKRKNLRATQALDKNEMMRRQGNGVHIFFNTLRGSPTFMNNFAGHIKNSQMANSTRSSFVLVRPIVLVRSIQFLRLRGLR